MAEDRVREDIAFIRRAIEEGSTYATARSPDMLVWGIAVRWLMRWRCCGSPAASF